MAADRLSAALVVLVVACVIILALLVALPRRGRRPVLGGRSKPRGAVGRRAARTRGEEVDDAAREPPVGLLAEGLPPGPGWDHQAFDIADGRCRPAPDGLYYGMFGRDALSRATLLTPQNLAWAARVTSGRVYSWVILDSPEGCFAVRAAPARGETVRLDPDELIAWVRGQLRGEPPHKMGLGEYVRWLTEKQGLTIAGGPARDPEVRFDLRDVTTAAERKATWTALAALDEEAFLALDWREYDAAVGQEACTSRVEVSGDVVIDLARGRSRGVVRAPKVRRVRPGQSLTYSRAYVNFHTHPAVRFHGYSSEPPSPQDLHVSLRQAAYHGLVWSFVSAPEGTYIYRPSRQLVEALRQREGHADLAAKVYEDSLEPCEAGVTACAARAVKALREAGFVAFFRKAPCAPLLERPDLAAGDNALDREAHHRELAALRAVEGPVLLSADWSQVPAMHSHEGIRSASWVRARYDPKSGVVTPISGHHFSDPYEADSYPRYSPGPLMVVYFSDDRSLPRAVPAAAISVAEETAHKWPWIAFMSPRRVLVFRAGPQGVETHGPRAFTPVAPA